MAKKIRQEGGMFLKLEEGNSCKGKFRRLAREVSGEAYEIPEDSQVIFAYTSKFGSKPLLIGEISFSFGDQNLQTPGTNFDHEYYPQISFLFVHRDFQEQGLGKMLLQECLRIIYEYESESRRPIRLQSAESAVGFFVKCGFHVVGEPSDYYQRGSKLFNVLVNMEKTLPP